MLGQGINIKAIKIDKFKTICIGILFTQKLEREYVTFNALLPNILTIASESYKSIREINIKTEEMAGASFYSDIIKKGEYQIIEFLIEFAENKVSLDDVFSFLSEIILKPLLENNSFKKENFEISKAIVIDNINARLNDKKEFAKNRCIELMCENERFGILADGYLEDFEGDKIDEKSLYRHYLKVLKESEINIIAIGNIDENNLKCYIDKYFNIEGRKFNHQEDKFVIKEQHKPKCIIEKFNVTQGKLCMGFRTGIEPNSKDFIPLLVGNEILGGGSSSKLFNNVREKESLCYYISSFIFMFKGIVFLESGVDFKQYDKVIKYIEKEIENIKSGNFSDLDIKNAISSIYKKYISILDYNTSTMDYYFTNYLANKNITIEETLEKIKDVKKEDIKSAFSNIWLDTCYFMKGDEN